MLKLFVCSTMAVLACVPVLASAQQTPPSSPHTVSGNEGIVSDYRYRGISQTFRQPAIQGGIDYAHASGLYLGNWNSSVSGLSYANGAGVEMDFYGGWKRELVKDTSLDIGLLQYYYPNAQMVMGNGKTKYDTLELYAAVSYRWLNLKYSRTLSDYFGFTSNTMGGLCNRDGANCYGAAPGDSRGSGYLEINANYELAPKLSFVAHIGHQKIRNYGKHDYTDYKLGVTYDMRGWLLGAAFVGTNADEKFYYLTDGAGRTRETGKAAVVLSVGKTF